METRDRGHGVFTVDGVLSAAECDALVHETETFGFLTAPITTLTGFEHRPEIRNNTRVMLDDRKRAKWLWERVQPWIPREYWDHHVVGLNERFRYYRYQAGQYFRWHRDGAYRRNNRERSLLTLMVYLNDGFTGGDTDFGHIEPVVPRKGMALVFEHRLRHCGQQVEQGTKYVLRTDVMYRGAPI
ncbi:MAG: 2OG-Fe(II) oxygenase [Myxococcota bacterium]